MTLPITRDCAACSNGDTAYPQSPVRLVGGMVSLLREYFSNPENIPEPSLRKFTWNPGDDSNILIEALTRKLDNTTMKRPAILVKRGPFYKSRKIALADTVTTFGDNPKEVRIGVFDGTLILWCLGANAIQAEYVADTIVNFITSFQHQIRNALCLLSLEFTEMGDVRLLPDAGDAFGVPVVFKSAYQSLWEINTVGPGVRKINFSVNAEI